MKASHQLGNINSETKLSQYVLWRQNKQEFSVAIMLAFISLKFNFDPLYFPYHSVIIVYDEYYGVWLWTFVRLLKEGITLGNWAICFPLLSVSMLS